MSSSFRKSLELCLGIATVTAGIALPLAAASGAQTFVQPQLDLRTEAHDNFDLLPDGTPDGDIYGFVADASAVIGIATPRSETTLRPRVKLQEYPDRDDLERIEGFLDLRSGYAWERADFLLIGRYAHQDLYNTETLSGEFDPLDPNFDGSADSSRVVVGETRTRFEVAPSLEYQLTERVRGGVAVGYEDVDFDADGPSTQTDYDFGQAKLSLSWALTQLSQIGVDTYVTRYQAKDDSTETDAYGAGLSYNYQWSEVDGIETRIFFEENDTTNRVPVGFEESTSGWGGSVTAYRKLEVSDWRLSIGRTYIPTGDGGKAESDLLRLQYRRSLSERLAFSAAGRYESRNALNEADARADRDSARADLSLEWFMRPTWYLRGGYSYVWQDREAASGDASDNILFFSVGYKGLQRQRP